jgi:nucleoid-associated protein YgaU
MTLEQVKGKYQPAIDLAKELGVSLANVHLENGKLLIKGSAPNEETKNEVWNKVKAIDPVFADLSLDLGIDPSLPVPVKTYTVVAGDSLSKIAKHFYGDAMQYPKIFEANRDQLSDPDKIQIGQVLKIPR